MCSMPGAHQWCDITISQKIRPYRKFLCSVSSQNNMWNLSFSLVNLELILAAVNKHFMSYMFITVVTFLEASHNGIMIICSWHL